MPTAAKVLIARQLSARPQIALTSTAKYDNNSQMLALCAQMKTGMQ